MNTHRDVFERWLCWFQMMNERVGAKGCTFLKLDCGPGLVRDTPGTTVYSDFWELDGV